MKAAAGAAPHPSPRAPSPQAPLYPTALNAVRSNRRHPSSLCRSANRLLCGPLRSFAVLSSDCDATPNFSTGSCAGPHIAPRGERGTQYRGRPHAERKRTDRPTCAPRNFRPFETPSRNLFPPKHLDLVSIRETPRRQVKVTCCSSPTLVCLRRVGPSRRRRRSAFPEVGPSICPACCPPPRGAETRQPGASFSACYSTTTKHTVTGLSRSLPR